MSKSPEQEILRKLCNASDWSFVEKLLLEDNLGRELIRTDKTCQEVIAYLGFPPTTESVGGRTVLVEITRFLLNQGYIQDNSKPFRRTSTHNRHSVGGMELIVHGVNHDREGIKEVGSTIKHSDLVVLEPNLLNGNILPGTTMRSYFTGAKEVMVMSRAEEMRYARLYEHGYNYCTALLLHLKIVPYFKAVREHAELRASLSKDQLLRIKKGINAPLTPPLARGRAAYIVGGTDPIEAIAYSGSSPKPVADIFVSASRSLGQGEFALEQARLRNLRSVDLVIGTAHAREMELIYGLPGVREEFLRRRDTLETRLPYALSKLPAAVKIVPIAGLVTVAYASC